MTGKGLKLLWVALAAYTLFHLAYSMQRYSVFEDSASGDFNRVLQDTAEWKSGTNASSSSGWHYHPPFYYAIVLEAESLVGGAQNVKYFFYFLQFLLFPAALFFLVRACWTASSRPAAWAYGAAAILAINFQPLLETLAQHKVEGIEFFLICLAIFLFRRKKDLLCGAGVMLAANLKYLPGILLAHFLVKREWKVLAGSLIGAGLVFAVVYAAFGQGVFSSGSAGGMLRLATDHEHEGNRPEASVEMQTLSGTVNRWFARPAGETPYMEYIRRGSYMPVPPEKTGMALRLAMLLKLFLIGIWLFALRKRWPRDQREKLWEHQLLEISLSLVMILVISQAARVHYGILLLPAFLIAGLLLLQQNRRFRLVEKSFFWVGYGLSAMLIPGGLLNRLPPHPFWGQDHSWMYLWFSFPFYGYLLLAVSLLLMRGRLLKDGS